jgi:hypothetical protein
MPLVRTAILGADQRIRPNLPGYKGPPMQAVFQVSQVYKDKLGEYQLINLLNKLNIRVPPLHTWPPGAYVPKPDWPPPVGPVLTLVFDPILPG